MRRPPSMFEGFSGGHSVGRKLPTLVLGTKTKEVSARSALAAGGAYQAQLKKFLRY